MSHARDTFRTWDEDPQPTNYGAGDCRRTSSHRFVCTTVLDFDDDSIICGSKVAVSFRGHRSRRATVRDVLGSADCYRTD